MVLIKATSWNWFSQIYIAVAGIAIIPIYMRHFGDESYGLIAFMLTIQMFMSLLDIGFSASLSRESSKFKAGVINSDIYDTFLNFVLKLFILTGLVFSSLVFLFSFNLAEDWLKLIELDADFVAYILKISAFIVFFRWISVFYRSIIFGYEDIVWLAKFTVVMATLRFLMVVPLLYYFSLSVSDYFYYQLLVQFFEVFVLIIRKKSILPFLSKKYTAVDIGGEYFKGAFKFMLAAGGATVLWLLISQLDRFYASNFLSLKDYGFYHTAVMAAGMITIITAPLVSSMQPRVTMLFASDDMKGVEEILKSLFDFMCILGFSLVMVVYFFGYELLRAWHGESGFADKVYLVFLIHCIAMAFLAINSCSYIVDYASGKLKLRNNISLFMLFFLAVAYPIAFYYFSAIGAAIVWLALNLLYAIFAQPILLAQHNKYLYRRVLKESLAPRTFQAVVLFFICLVFFGESRITGFASIYSVIFFASLFGCIILLLFLLLKTDTRLFLISYISRFYVSTKS